MADIGKVEYRVRPITRYQVTRHFEDAHGTTGGTEQKGEYDNSDVAYQVACALCKSEHERLGFPLDDERIVYPRHPSEIGRLIGGDVKASSRDASPLAG